MPESSVDSYINAQPEQAMSFDDYYSKYSGLGTGDYNNIWLRLGNFFSGHTDKMKQQYETYLQNLNNRNEFKAVQSARAWDKMMNDTQIQRQMADLKAAGLNPYLLLNNGSIGSSSSPTSAKASYSNSSKKESGNGSGKDLALILLAVARVAAALL